MRLLKQIDQITHDSGVETKLRVLVYDSMIQWHRSERMQFYEGESWTVNQTVDEYLADGPPDLVHDLEPDKKIEIQKLLMRK